jgi:hypothetical protein
MGETLAQNAASGFDGDDYLFLEKGVIVKTKIVEVRTGKATEFHNEKYFEKSKDAKKAKEGVCLFVRCENGAREVYNLPALGEAGVRVVNPKAKLSRFKRTYQKLPAVGVEVNTMISDAGYPRIVLVE